MNAGRRSGEIDALRCVAMFSVIGLHSHLLPCGWVGVWLFYAISGYVVTLSVLAQHPGESGRARLGSFTRRRIARIAPVYYAFIGTGLIVGLAQGLPQDNASIASLVGFYENALAIVGRGQIKGWPTGHLWTLSIEVQFYALYGLALCLLPRRMTAAVLIAFLLLCPMARLAASWWLQAHHWRPLDAAYAVYAGPGLHFDTFAMGGLLAFSRVAGRIDRIARPLFYAGAALLACYVGVYLGIGHFVGGQHGTTLFRNIVSGILFGQYREVFLYSAIGLFTTGLVALASTGDALVAPLLARRTLQWVGEISYGGYLFHVLGLAASDLLLMFLGANDLRPTVIGHVIKFCVCIIVTLPLAYASYRWFEVPIRRKLTVRATPGLTITTRGAMAQ